ncbi:MAG: hypothetical protein GXP63_01305 [DPANN group archaeon]|nr:hypothetical protein [DPANN group archaeon]
MARKHRPLWNNDHHELVTALLGMLFAGLALRQQPAVGLVALQSSFEPYDGGALVTFRDYGGILNCVANFDNNDPFHIGKVTAFVAHDDVPYVLFDGWDSCIRDPEGNMALRELYCQDGEVLYLDGHCTAGYTSTKDGCRCS